MEIRRTFAMFPSSYEKIKAKNSSLFVVMGGDNSEKKINGVLGFKERLANFIEHRTEITDSGS